MSRAICGSLAILIGTGFPRIPIPLVLAQQLEEGTVSPGVYEVIRSTPVLKEPHGNAAVIAELRPPTRVNVVGAAEDYLEVQSRKGRPSGYVFRGDIVPVREDREAARLTEEPSGEEKRQERLLTQEGTEGQKETERVTEQQRKEGERQQQADSKLAKKLIEEGIKAYQEGKYQEAVDKLTGARPLAPSHSPVVLYLGLAYLKQDKISEAIATWRQYTNLEPYTKEERKGDLKTNVTEYLKLLLQEENHRVAQEAMAREKELGLGNPRTVAITYYRNLGSPELSPLQKGLTALLISDISQVKELTVVERDRLQALLEELQLGTTGLVDEKTAPKVGRLLGAGKVATGNFGNFLDKEEMRIDSVLADTTAQVVGTQETSGQLQQFYELEKRLALNLLEDLGYDKEQLRAAGVLDRIRQPHTTSWAAFEAFSAGLDAKDGRDYAAARTQFEQALRNDPNFELARRELLALPLMALSIGGIVSAVEGNAPSASAATASMAGGSWISGTTAAVIGIGAAVAGIVAGVLASGGGSGGGKRPKSPGIAQPSSSPTGVLVPPRGGKPIP